MIDNAMQRPYRVYTARRGEVSDENNYNIYTLKGVRVKMSNNNTEGTRVNV